MAAETISEAGIASQRSRPLANTSLPTNSTLCVVCNAWGGFVISGCWLLLTRVSHLRHAVHRAENILGVCPENEWERSKFTRVTGSSQCLIAPYGADCVHSGRGWE